MLAEADINYFEHHIGDYDADTAHLTWVEDMAYTRLMRLYYRREKPIPADINDACRLVRAASKDQRQAVADVLKEFFVLADDGWHQGRCDAELARYLKKVEHNRAVGKLGGRPKKTETQQKPGGLSLGSETEPEHNPLQSPDSSNQTPRKERESARGSRLPPEWTPPVEHMAFAESLGLRNGKATAELAKFRDYWAAQPGQKGVKTDWPATWRNWCRRAVDGSLGGSAGVVDGVDAGQKAADATLAALSANRLTPEEIEASRAAKALVMQRIRPAIRRVT